MFFFVKVIVAALILSFCSWLSNKRPDLAGFIVALPLTTLIVLAFSYVEYRDPAKSVAFAKSIFVGIPISLTFFLPFLFSNRFGLSFGTAYFLGLALLTGGYFVHKALVPLL